MKKCLSAMRTQVKKKYEFNLRSLLCIISHFQNGKVTLLWRRAVGDPEFGRIFCLVHAEKLAYKVCDDVLKSLDRHTQGKRGTDKYAPVSCNGYFTSCLNINCIHHHFTSFM